MKFIADFHIHSHFSIATSKNLCPEHLDYWARVKGITVVGTGDFTHPGWLAELKEKLDPAEQGLFKLKKEYILDDVSHIPSLSQSDVRFILTAEISSIYKKADKVRKVHNVIFAPGFDEAERIQEELSKIGNITSDGRPILGLDSRDLMEIALNASENIFFVPAHIWTPWFSALGDKSGFDTIEECYGDLAHHIFAVETGLSSDPAMNWMCSFLDKYTLISNSDAHSPEKLGREANHFDTDMNYPSIIGALKDSNTKHFLGTIEFFPQEGKYHYDGHRKCGVCWNPLETLKHQAVCPECGKKVTVGVMNRVAQLSDRQDLKERKNQAEFYSLIPLKEILSEITGVGPGSKQVSQKYNSLIQKIGSEFNILLHLPVDEIGEKGSELLAEAVRRMREREVYIQEGFDGQYGVIKVFREDEQKSISQQNSLFAFTPGDRETDSKPRGLINFDLEEYRRLKEEQPEVSSVKDKSDRRQTKAQATDLLDDLNPDQRRAVEHFTGPALIVAGPGTGKTRVLTYRIAHLIQKHGILPENILAVTFTNKAAEEMKERLRLLLDKKEIISNLTVSTFHAFGYSILKKQHRKTGRTEHFLIIDSEDKERILSRELHYPKEKIKATGNAITDIKQNLKSEDEINRSEWADVFQQYETFLTKQNAFDLDDLICCPVRLFGEFPDMLVQYQKGYRWILVDEYQDINYGQYRMIRHLMPEGSSNLCVIGDPHQAIYGFRGADVRFIQKFKDDYPSAEVFQLKQSYRCSERILRASGNIILSTTENLESEKGKQSPSDAPEYDSRTSYLQGMHEGVKINISRQRSDKSEAEFVARAIESMMGGLRFFSIDSDITPGDGHAEINSLSDFAVLCRIRQQMKAIEEAFHDHSIPYQTVEDMPFFRREPVRSVIDLLKLSLRPESEFLKSRLSDASRISSSEPDRLTSLAQNTDSVKNLITRIVDHYYKEDKSSNEIVFKKLLSLADDFGNDTEAFLKFAALGIGVDTYHPNTEAVTLMTLHAAKGLEFECVFIVGCENGLLPYSLFASQPSDTEEERRLLYVGMTRAKKHLFLSHSDRRFLIGREYNQERSPFLDHIEKELVEHAKSEYKKREKKKDDQMGLF
jgi:uncharacterized protein (TIGR00375 family)